VNQILEFTYSAPVLLISEVQGNRLAGGPNVLDKFTTLGGESCADSLLHDHCVGQETVVSEEYTVVLLQSLTNRPLFLG